ncbi:eCIS core domain-containing protein [Chitinophaga japonensis]|uniref:Uncharacterized protein DUF4157 n=1 Tax=Chitinophaga japonensis TaxID=104662 RepID=A0A562T2P4_CHIJA|nr:DUF4157 domain-containing protein [Chitinophaga japonensis]TWI87010.1 uncharacterized protein DUF4157 [Chitinophaga japonensis]
MHTTGKIKHTDKAGSPHGVFFPPAPQRVQTKLTVNEPGDIYEQEADAVADKVMTMPEGAAVQRKCAACEQEEQLQRKEEGPPLNDEVTASLNSSKGGGQLMQHETRDWMENRFGTDFSSVRIHTDSRAVQLSRDLNAHAFTHGTDIYFNQGQYSPGSSEGRRLLAHELTHVVQQRGDELGRKKKIQRAAAYWMPRHQTGDDVHDEVLPAMGTKNSAKNVYSEVPVPNATAGGVDLAGTGKIGYADLLTTNNNILVGVYKVGEGELRNIADEKLKKQIFFNGKKFSKEKFRKHTAPLWNDHLKTPVNLGNVPTQVDVADLKPYEQSIMSAGVTQTGNYEKGLLEVKDVVNGISGPGTWTLNVGKLSGLDIPDQYKFPSASGQASKQLLITFSGIGSLLSALKAGGQLNRIREYETIRNNNVEPGKLYVVEEANGIYAYAYVPDYYTNPAQLASMPGATGLPATPPFSTLMQTVEQDIKGRLRGTSFALKKAMPPQAKPAPPPQPKQTPTVQRKEKHYEEKFELDKWEKSLEGYQGKFDSALKTKEMHNLITYADKVHAYNEFRKQLPKAGLSALSADNEKPARLLHSLEVWTYPGVGALGLFRKLFGKTFVNILNTYEHVKEKIRKLATAKDGGSVSGIAAAALRIALKVIKLIGNFVVSESLQLVSASLMEGISRNLQAMFDNLVPEELQAKIDEVEKLKEKYTALADKTIEQWKEGFFGSWIGKLEKVEEMRQEIQPKLEMIEKMVRWGAGIIACASPPAIGCLWNIFKEVGMYFIAKIIQTCWFGKKIMKFVLGNVSFITTLPQKIATGITSYANDLIPLPKGMEKLFAPVKPVDVNKAEISCSDFGEGGGSGDGGQRGEIWDIIDEIGEEKFKAFLEMMNKRGAGPWVLLTPERLKSIKDDLIKTNIADLQQLAAGETPENGVPVNIATLLKDISRYTAREKAVKEEFFEEKKKREEEKHGGEDGAAGKGTGGDKAGGGDGGATTGDTATKAKKYSGTLKKGTMKGSGEGLSAGYAATAYTKKLNPGDSIDKPVQVDLRIYKYEGGVLSEIVEANGMSFTVSEVTAEKVTFILAEDTLIEYEKSTLIFPQGVAIKVKHAHLTYK